MQELRFSMLLKSGVQSGDTVLDVGCGFGDLFPFLAAQGIDVVYTGVDLSPDLIIEARARHPGGTFFEGDLFDFDPAARSFDYVFLSGSLNEQLQDGGEYARRCIARMFETCDKALAFNLLDARNEWVAGRQDLQSFMPDDVLAFARTLTPQCELDDGYIDNDFTLYLTRADAPGSAVINIAVAL